jgi:hypothetical protein
MPDLVPPTQFDREANDAGCSTSEASPLTAQSGD